MEIPKEIYVGETIMFKMVEDTSCENYPEHKFYSEEHVTSVIKSYTEVIKHWKQKVEEQSKEIEQLKLANPYITLYTCSHCKELRYKCTCTIVKNI